MSGDSNHTSICFDGINFIFDFRSVLYTGLQAHVFHLLSYRARGKRTIKQTTADGFHRSLFVLSYEVVYKKSAKEKISKRTDNLRN